jgi:hypothetical protein
VFTILFVQASRLFPSHEAMKSLLLRVGRGATVQLMEGKGAKRKWLFLSFFSFLLFFCRRRGGGLLAGPRRARPLLQERAPLAVGAQVGTVVLFCFFF